MQLENDPNDILLKNNPYITYAKETNESIPNLLLLNEKDFLKNPDKYFFKSLWDTSIYIIHSKVKKIVKLNF